MARGAEGGAWVQGWGARAGRAARACGVPARRSAAGGGDSAASNLQIKGGKAPQGTAAGKATGLIHLGQGGRGG